MSWISYDGGSGYVNLDLVQSFHANDNGDGTFVLLAVMSGFSVKVDTGATYTSAAAVNAAAAAYLGANLVSSL